MDANIWFLMFVSSKVNSINSIGYFSDSDESGVCEQQSDAHDVKGKWLGAWAVPSVSFQFFVEYVVHEPLKCCSFIAHRLTK